MIPIPHIDPKVEYPESDGKPMADNTEQYKWLVKIKENLEIWYSNVPDVFIAGDLFWYPVQDRRIIGPNAPDVMVVFGRPKGKRGSYRQWEEDNIPPQVVFEIRSPSNTEDEMERKFQFYQKYGVEEYYLYDPETNQLEGWLREGERLRTIPQMDGWVSPRIGIRFELGETELEIYRPDGRKFLTSIELEQRAEQERARAEEALLQLEQERRRVEQMAEYLCSLGIDPDNFN